MAQKPKTVAKEEPADALTEKRTTPEKLSKEKEEELIIHNLETMVLGKPIKRAARRGSIDEKEGLLHES